MFLSDIHNARKQFGQAPVGTWESYLGGSNDMHIGMKLVFHVDGTGTMQEWGFDHHYLNPEHVSEPAFRWRTTGTQRIEITHEGETRQVNYDFKATKNEYGIKELRMFEPGMKPDEYGEIGFWKSPFSMVYCEQPEAKVPIILRRFWERIKRIR